MPDLQAGSSRAFLPLEPLCCLFLSFLSSPTLMPPPRSSPQVASPCSEVGPLLKCQLQVMKTVWLPGGGEGSGVQPVFLLL